MIWCMYSSTRPRSNPELDTTIHVHVSSERVNIRLSDDSGKVSGYGMHISKHAEECY